MTSKPATDDTYSRDVPDPPRPVSGLSGIESLFFHALAVLIVVAAFHVTYADWRSRAGVAPDNLLYYNMLMSWWRHGAPLTGYTLTPSPYFVDLVLQLPIALVAQDFERFAYCLALSYAVLLFVTVSLLAKRVLAVEGALASCAAALAVGIYYVAWPFVVIGHVFIQSHTSEVFCTLGLVGSLAWFLREDVPASARRATLISAGYTVAVAGFVASSPFFIATYCAPILLSSAVLIGTNAMPFRRYAWFSGFTVVGTIGGMLFDSWLAARVWPIRTDDYALTPLQSARAMITAFSDANVTTLIAGVGAVSIVCAVAAIVYRLRKREPSGVLLLAFVPASAAACTILPVLRGAFDSSYALRFLQLPFLLTTVVAAVAVMSAAVDLVRAAVRFVSPPLRPSGGTARRAAAVLVSLVAARSVVSAGAPLTMLDPGSTTSEMIKCVQAAERELHLGNGVASVIVARFINAARHGDSWRSASEIVQSERWFPPMINASENELRWIAEGDWRAGAQFDFFATHGHSDENLHYISQMFGAPQRVAMCPVPRDMRIDEKTTFEIWSWSDPVARARLTSFVAKNNMRGPFAPWRDAQIAPIDPVWGMYSRAGQGALEGEKRVWRRGLEQPRAEFASSLPMFIPAGRFRAQVRLHARAATIRPAMTMTVLLDYRWVAQVTSRTDEEILSVDFESHNRGTTSGHTLVLLFRAEDAERIELESSEVERLSAAGVDPFRVFR
jgi:hypothetical protein